MFKLSFSLYFYAVENSRTRKKLRLKQEESHYSRSRHRLRCREVVKSGFTEIPRQSANDIPTNIEISDDRADERNVVDVKITAMTEQENLTV